MAKRNKGRVRNSLAPQQQPETPLELFLDRVKKDVSYLTSFLMALELNKIEATHQKYDQPAIFRKCFDDLGAITGFEINSRYEAQVHTPRREFSIKEMRAALDMIEEDPKGVNVFLLTNQAEAMMLNMMTPEQFENMPPPLRRDFDEQGLPTAYGLNLPDGEFIESVRAIVEGREPIHKIQ